MNQRINERVYICMYCQKTIPMSTKLPHGWTIRTKERCITGYVCPECSKKENGKIL